MDLDEYARGYQFEEGLSDEVKDGLAVNPNKPTAFEDYVDMCSVIENQLFARRQTKKRSGNAPRQNKPVKKTVETKTTTQQLAVTGTHSGPMDTSAGAALTGKARNEWRKANKLCPYCGDKQNLEVCPKLAAKNSRAAAATVTSDSPARVLYTSAPSENWKTGRIAVTLPVQESSLPALPLSHVYSVPDLILMLWRIPLLLPPSLVLLRKKKL